MQPWAIRARGERHRWIGAGHEERLSDTGLHADLGGAARLRVESVRRNDEDRNDVRVRAAGVAARADARAVQHISHLLFSARIGGSSTGEVLRRVLQCVETLVGAAVAVERSADGHGANVDGNDAS